MGFVNQACTTYSYSMVDECTVGI